MKKLSVLVADDYEDNLLLIREILKSLGHDYQLCKNGKEAFNKIQENDYDVVFLDIEMPKMNGIETARAIRNLDNFVKKNVPIIAISAYSIENFEERLKIVGFDDFIAKPYSPIKIMKVFTKYIEEF